MTTMPTGKEPRSEPDTTPPLTSPPPQPTTPSPPPGFDEQRLAARKRVQAKRDLYAHVVVYVVINAFFVGVWALTGQGYFWPAWIMGGWGIGLVLNAWDVLFRRPITEDDVERELRRRR
jgi:hypothetical protein